MGCVGRLLSAPSTSTAALSAFLIVAFCGNESGACCGPFIPPASILFHVLRRVGAFVAGERPSGCYRLLRLTPAVGFCDAGDMLHCIRSLRGVTFMRPGLKEVAMPLGSQLHSHVFQAIALMMRHAIEALDELSQ